jgi:hypothetical protein
VRTGSTFEADPEKPLFDTHVKGAFNNYAVSGDGQRFLTNDYAETSAPPITVVLNWTADLKR